jgi:uncharacterized protein (TIGR00255 family)
MTLSSMTGFARSSGARGELHWQWEVKSVNNKALDLRCRLPAGFEALEPPVRAALARDMKRGSFQVALTVSGAAAGGAVTINDDVLEQILQAGERLRDRIGGEALRADVLLGLRGVLDVAEPGIDEAELEARNGALLASFAEALTAMAASRRQEGERLKAVIAAQLDRIEALAGAARDCPARGAEAIRARLAEQVARLMETGASFDRDRLHQEAVMIATRSDIQEELDRLFSHVAAARALLQAGEAVGRKFDFLAQEFNREANTLCSKAIDKSLTAIGLDLKTVIDQLREQVQNIE